MNPDPQSENARRPDRKSPMKAAVFEQFQMPLQVREVPVPDPRPDSAVIAVRACGLCRSDWHGWMGHDSDVHLPHVPGHELAGEIVAVGNRVNLWQTGSRVTVPFCCGCGLRYCRKFGLPLRDVISWRCLSGTNSTGRLDCRPWLWRSRFVGGDDCCCPGRSGHRH